MGSRPRDSASSRCRVLRPARPARELDARHSRTGRRLPRGHRQRRQHPRIGHPRERRSGEPDAGTLPAPPRQQPTDGLRGVVVVWRPGRSFARARQPGITGGSSALTRVVAVFGRHLAAQYGRIGRPATAHRGPPGPVGRPGPTHSRFDASAPCRRCRAPSGSRTYLRCCRRWFLRRASWRTRPNRVGSARRPDHESDRGELEGHLDTRLRVAEPVRVLAVRPRRGDQCIN